MKKISLFLVSCFLLQSFAWAGPKDNLKAVLDDYRYAVTVEWDQKDKAQFEAYKAQFTAELTKLIQEDKLSAKDVSDFIKENANELNIDEHTMALLKDKNGQLNLERAQQFLESNSDRLYVQGSSWAPDELLMYGVIALIVVELVVLIATSREDTCPNPASHPNDITYGCIYE